MLRKITFGTIWFLVLYFGSCALIGGIAGGMAGAKDPENAAYVGALAGAAAVEPIKYYLLAASLLTAILGAYKGFLPGLRKKTAKID